MTPRALAQELEAERFRRFGLGQAAMRIACSVIADVLYRHGPVPQHTLLQALQEYPVQDFHADKERFRCARS